MKRWHRHTVILVVLAAAISAALLLWSGRAHARVGLRLHIDVPLRAPCVRDCPGDAARGEVA